MGNILHVGAESTVQGGDMGAVGTVVQNVVWAFDTVEQKDVVAAGCVKNCWSCAGKESFTQSSVISAGLKVSDPVLEVGVGRCAGDIHPLHTSGSYGLPLRGVE